MTPYVRPAVVFYSERSHAIDSLYIFHRIQHFHCNFPVGVVSVCDAKTIWLLGIARISQALIRYLAGVYYSFLDLVDDYGHDN